jgi:hypothetical protein
LSVSRAVPAAIAVAIHVVIIAWLLGYRFTGHFASGSDTIEGSGDGAEIGGMPVKAIWHTHTLVIVNDSGAPLDSARVRDLISGKLFVTEERGRVTFMTRAGAMFVVRVTKRGYEGVKLRLPNEVSESAARNIHLAKLPADTNAH